MFMINYDNVVKNEFLAHTDKRVEKKVTCAEET